MHNEQTDLECYKTLPIWTADTLPDAFKVRHNTKSGTWAKLVIFSGHLTMELISNEEVIIERKNYSKESQPPFIPPQQYHRIASYSEDLRCQLSFYALKNSSDKNPTKNS